MKRAVFVILAAFLSTVFAYSLLIGHADPGQTSGVQTNIAGDPYYDTVDLENWCGQTPTVEHLLEYDCVFTWSSQPYQDKTTLGNNLADYVDSGGAVVILNFCWNSSWGLAGRIMSDPDYCPLGQVWSDRGRDSQDMGDYDADHPIMAGVESITDIEYWEYLDVCPGATWLADLTNSYALAGINADQNVVGINMYPGDTHYWQGDGWILFNNAIQYLMDPDTAPPYVDGMYPGEGEYGPPDTDIVFHCRDDGCCVDLETIDFTARDTSLSGGRAIGRGAAVGSAHSPNRTIPGDLNVDDTDPRDVVCTFYPDDELPWDTITCTVDGSLADGLGYEMGEDFIWWFTTIWDVEEASWGALKTAF
jgi:hypothetical protein